MPTMKGFGTITSKEEEIASGFIEVDLSAGVCSLYEQTPSKYLAAALMETRIPITVPVEFSEGFDINFSRLGGGKVVRLLPSAQGATTGTPGQGLPAEWDFPEFMYGSGPIPDRFDGVQIEMRKIGELFSDPPQLIKIDGMTLERNPDSFIMRFDEGLTQADSQMVEESFWSFVQIVTGESVQWHLVRYTNGDDAFVYRNIAYVEAPPRKTCDREGLVDLGDALPFFGAYRDFEKMVVDAPPPYLSGTPYETSVAPLYRLASLNTDDCSLSGDVQLRDVKCPVLCSVIQALHRFALGLGQTRLRDALDFVVEEVSHLLNVDMRYVEDFNVILKRFVGSRNAWAHYGALPFHNDPKKERDDEVMLLITRAFVMKSIGMDDQLVLRFMRETCVKGLERFLFKSPADLPPSQVDRNAPAQTRGTRRRMERAARKAEKSDRKRTTRRPSNSEKRGRR